MKYLIRLKPLDKFFFGGEITSGASGNKNYFLKSNAFPQQTAILGMLRKEILIQTKIFNSNGVYSDEEKKIMTGKIGNKSFDINLKEIQDFGIIKKISPLFIINNESKYYCAPKYYLEDGLKLEFSNENVDTNLPQGKVQLLKNFDSKMSFYNGFINIDTGDLTPFYEVFKQDETVGIDKQNSDEAFYKQVYYRLKNSYEFAFYLKLGDSFELNNSLVQLGAETSTFKMTVENIEQIPEHTLSDDKQLVLLSDFLVEPSIYEKCTFAITDTTDFRTAAFNEKFKFKGKSSVKYILLQRGSVLFSDKIKELKSALQHSNMEKIGYNIIEVED